VTMPSTAKYAYVMSLPANLMVVHGVLRDIMLRDPRCFLLAPTLTQKIAGHLFQCPEGHILCSPCFSLIGGADAPCPTCGLMIGKIRNRAVEKYRASRLRPIADVATVCKTRQSDAQSHGLSCDRESGNIDWNEEHQHDALPTTSKGRKCVRRRRSRKRDEALPAARVAAHRSASVLEGHTAFHFPHRVCVIVCACVCAFACVLCCLHTLTSNRESIARLPVMKGLQTSTRTQTKSQIQAQRHSDARTEPRSQVQALTSSTLQDRAERQDSQKGTSTTSFGKGRATSFDRLDREWKLLMRDLHQELVLADGWYDDGY
jgi:hypothetical protein